MNKGLKNPLGTGLNGKLIKKMSDSFSVIRHH